jgi:hypothetical protein
MRKRQNACLIETFLLQMTNFIVYMYIIVWIFISIFYNIKYIVGYFKTYDLTNILIEGHTIQLGKLIYRNF